MKEFAEKLIERLEDRIAYNKLCHEEFPNAKMAFTYEVQINSYKNAIEIINQLAEEYNNTSTDKSTNLKDKIYGCIAFTKDMIVGILTFNIPRIQLDWCLICETIKGNYEIVEK